MAEPHRRDRELPFLFAVGYGGGIYMIDFDLPKFLPELLHDLERNFKLDLLPRGQRCLLRFQPLKGHPFMGPNLYVTPPGSFTHFHQDGHGTVDSGHQCLRGRNEVVMLQSHVNG